MIPYLLQNWRVVGFAALLLAFSITLTVFRIERDHAREQLAQEQLIHVQREAVRAGQVAEALKNVDLAQKEAAAASQRAEDQYAQMVRANNDLASRLGRALSVRLTPNHVNPNASALPVNPSSAGRPVDASQVTPVSATAVAVTQFTTDCGDDAAKLKALQDWILQTRKNHEQP